MLQNVLCIQIIFTQIFSQNAPKKANLGSNPTDRIDIPTVQRKQKQLVSGIHLHCLLPLKPLQIFYSW